MGSKLSPLDKHIPARVIFVYRFKI